MAEKLDVERWPSGSCIVRKNGVDVAITTNVNADESAFEYAHKFAAVDGLIEAIEEYLRWENSAEDEYDSMEATERLAIALAASRVPEKTT